MFNKMFQEICNSVNKTEFLRQAVNRIRLKNNIHRQDHRNHQNYLNSQDNKDNKNNLKLTINKSLINN